MKISEMEVVSKARPAEDHSNFYIIDNSDRSFASGNSNPVNERSSPSPSLSLSLSYSLTLARSVITFLITELNLTVTG